MKRILWGILALGLVGACTSHEDSKDEHTAEVTQAFAPPPGSETTFQVIAVRDSPYTVRGDFNGDGRLDYAYGDWRHTEGGLPRAGRVLVYHTHSCGEVPDRLPDQIWVPGSDGLAGAPTAFGRFGIALAAADLNGDNVDDLVIGAPGMGAGVAASGEIQVLYGSSAGLRGTGSLRLDQNTPGMADLAETGDDFGYALAAGDFDCDGISDVAVGIPNEQLGNFPEAGAGAVLYGSAAGLGPIGSQFFHRGIGDIALVPSAFDHFGYSLVAAGFGKPSGIACDDLAVGVPDADEAANGAGAVHVLYGDPTGLLMVGTDHFHEAMPTVDGNASAGERFGAELGSWDDDHDGHDDLLVYTASTECSVNTATHLLYGSPVGVIDFNDEFACGEQRGPRFSIPVDPPQPPTAYVPPPGIMINDAATLEAHLENNVAEVLILADGVYDLPSEVRPLSADQVWAANLGQAVLRFGLYYQNQPPPFNIPSELHGLTFDMSVIDPNVVIGGDGSSRSAIVAAAPSGSASMSLVIEDCFFYGHDWVDIAVQVTRPENTALRRLVVRDVHEFGVLVNNPGNAFPNPVVVVEDLDIAGVFKPDGEDGLDNNGNAHPTYYCIEEVGLFVGYHLEHANVERVRVRDTRCTAIETAVNRNENVSDAGDYEHLDVDCAGYWPPTPIASGDKVPVTNAGLYLQESSYADYRHIHIGPNTNDGIRSEWTGDNEFNTIQHALIESHRLGISLDAKTDNTTVSNIEIHNAYCAGVLDNYCGAPWGGSCDPLLTTNTISNASYHLPPGVVTVDFHNANQCPSPPP